MQSLNILILDGGKHQYIKSVSGSEHIKKLYIVSDEEFEGAVNIKFNTFKELAQKCKSLQIDMVLVENEKWILQGVADVLRKNFINCIALTSNWTRLVLDKRFAKHLVELYGINTPETVRFPNEFPLVVKSDRLSKVGYSMNEIISIRKEFANFSPEIEESIFIEKYLEGFQDKLISLYDGKNLLTFPSKEIPLSIVEEYNDKLNTMLISEKADFIGFLASNVIYDGTKLYNIGFSLDYSLPDGNLIYPLILAIYQKLNEITI